MYRNFCVWGSMPLRQTDLKVSALISEEEMRGESMKQVSGWNKTLLKEVSSDKPSKSRAAIRRKLARIRQKLMAGGRLTAEEKAFLRRYAPKLYEEAMAMERERAAYEERLKRCRTKEEAERIKTEKMMETADAKEEDKELRMMRMAQIKAAEDASAPAVNRKPSQVEKEKKRIREEKRKRDARTVAERKEFDKARRERERADRRRRDDRYYESERLKEEAEEDYRKRKEGVIYKKPGYGGREGPEDGGIMILQAGGGTAQMAAAADGAGPGAGAYGNGRRAYARGYEAYEAAAAAEASKRS